MNTNQNIITNRKKVQQNPGACYRHKYLHAKCPLDCPDKLQGLIPPKKKRGVNKTTVEMYKNFYDQYATHSQKEIEIYNKNEISVPVVPTDHIAEVEKYAPKCDQNIHEKYNTQITNTKNEILVIDTQDRIMENDIFCDISPQDISNFF